MNQGINVEKFKKVINSTDTEATSINSAIKSMNSSAENLIRMFNDNDLGEVTRGFYEIKKNQNKITAILGSYKDVLTQITTSYQKQDELMGEALRNIDTNN